MATPSPPCVSVVHLHPLGQPSAIIKELAENLRKDGIDALLDLWELSYGQDIYAYLEHSIHDEQIQQVLIVMDEVFLEKAKQHVIEQLLRPVIYGNVQQQRIIPLLYIKQGQLPPYLQSRFAIDFNQEGAYETLVRLIYQDKDKPTLGARPAFLDTPAIAATAYLENLAHSREIDEESAHFFQDFTTTYQEAGSAQYPALYQAWQVWLNRVIKTRSSATSLDAGLLIETLERLLHTTTLKEEFEATHFLQLLFLTAVVVGFEKRNFKLLGQLLHGHYYEPQGNLPKRFVTFNNGSASNNHLATHAIADYTHEQLSYFYTTKQIVEADLMCYYVAAMEGLLWVPFTAKYLPQATVYPISWLQKLNMKKFFEKTKALYGVEEVAAFYKKVNIAYLQERKPRTLPYNVRPLQKAGVPRRVNIL